MLPRAVSAEAEANPKSSLKDVDTLYDAKGPHTSICLPHYELLTYLADNDLLPAIPNRLDLPQTHREVR